MAVIKLGNRPKTFKPFNVKIALPDGSDGEIPVTFKYRTQDEYWEYRNEFFKLLGVKRDRGDMADLPDIAKEGRRHAAEHLLDAIDTWGLDVPLSVDALCDLLNEVQSSSTALMLAYQSACVEGRLGN